MALAAYLRSVCVWLVLALLSTAGLSAQKQLFRQYGVSEGLDNLHVRCLLQDRTGFLWVGTDNGLFRYDGAVFQKFSHEEGLPSAEIVDLAESPSGVLWVATQIGIARLAGKRFQPVAIGQDGEVRTIALDSQERIYLHIASGILRGLPDGNGSIDFQMEVRGAVRGMLVDPGGSVLFGKDGGLWRLADNHLERVSASAGLPVDNWDAITRDSLGNLWIRSKLRLFEQVAGGPRFVERTAGIAHAAECHLYADRHGRVYVSTDTGLAVLDRGHVETIDARHGFPADSGGAVLVDREESLWIGTEGGSLVRRLGHGEWMSWRREDGLPHNTVWAIWHDSAGQLWAGTEAGLGIFNSQGRVLHSWNNHNGLAGDRIFSIVEAPAGDFFVGTDPAGISHFDKHGVLLRTAVSGYDAEQVLAMTVDREHRLWAMGTGGCFRTRSPLQGSTPLAFERMTIPGIPAQTTFRSVTTDEAGAVWMASSRGLVRFYNGSWKVFSERDGLKASDLGAVVADRGNLWIAYRDALGISFLHWNGHSFAVTHFTEQSGLCSNAVFALAIDLRGRLWASTDKGVNVSGPERWTRFSNEDGLVWNDTSGLALSVDSAGDVWIGTSRGLSRYTALPYPLAEAAPPIVLTSVKGVSREWQPGDRPALPYSQRSLSFSYAGLSFSSESRVHFRYRLVGYERTWNDTSERNVRYAALPPGKYVFEVLAQGPNSLWSPEPARFAFSVHSPWWRAWWFVLTCLAVAGLLGYALWYLRMRVLITQKKQLERQVADRTLELRESHRQLEQIAYCDTLTSLPNRRRFTEELQSRLDQARRQGRSLALLLTDLDRFKQINDTFGHEAGDSVLIEAAFRLRGAVRDSDCVARLGGDEFAILLAPSNDRHDIEAVCKRIQESFALEIGYRGSSLKLGCSVGIAVFPQDGDTQETLYRSADLALYEAKRSGRNLFSWYRPKDAVSSALVENAASSSLERSRA